MPWNWQNPAWPSFMWDRTQIASAEEQFLLGSGVVVRWPVWISLRLRNCFVLFLGAKRMRQAILPFLKHTFAYIAKVGMLFHVASDLC